MSHSHSIYLANIYKHTALIKIQTTRFTPNSDISLLASIRYIIDDQIDLKISGDEPTFTNTYDVSDEEYTGANINIFR